MSRLKRYEQRVDAPLTIGAVAFLVVYALPILWQKMPRSGHTACDTVSTLLWVVFAVDLVVRTWLHEHRVQFLLRHPIDVLIVAVPVLRPLRVLRIFTATQMLLTRGGLLRTGQAIASSAALLVFVGALAELDAERGAAGANITTFGDALWWAVSTVTTVGYGDVYPVTGTGRLVAAGLMLVGISLVGTITATVAAWFVAQRQAQADRTSLDVRQLTAEIEALRAELASSQAVGAPLDPIDLRDGQPAAAASPAAGPSRAPAGS